MLDEDPVKVSLTTVDRATVALQYVNRQLQSCAAAHEPSERDLMDLLAALEALRAAQRDCFLLTAPLGEWISIAGGTAADMDWPGDSWSQRD